MAKLDITVKEVQSPNRRRANHVLLHGIISSPTLNKFRDEIDDSVNSGLDLILDFTGVHYINSSGLGHLLQLRDELQARECSLVLIAVSPDVMVLIEMLGLHNVLPIKNDIEEGLLTLDEGVMFDLAMDIENAGVTTGAIVDKRKPSLTTPKPSYPDAKIILGFECENHLTKLIVKCFIGEGKLAGFATTKTDFLRILHKNKVDVVVLDSNLPEFNEIIALLKSDTEGGLIPIITVYSDGDEQQKSHSFRFIEDEYVVEPFDVREIMATIECEYKRCKDSEVAFKQEAEFKFDGSDEKINKAINTIADMMATVNIEQVSKDSFLYAVREGIDNARKHGNKQVAEKHIEVLYVIDKEKVTIIIQDEGEGFDYKEIISAANKYTPIERARQNHKIGKQGGLGVSLMLRCCDKVEFVSPGNTVKLTKYFTE